ncbi:MAG TPA: hypothetical protein VLK27_01640 [Chthoniobacterales bacterium]|nr:hypothetical protein [Chthoniobacterales bacterium]
MKAVAALFLIGLAAAYYFGYDPSDFIPSFQSSAPPPRGRREPAPTEETQNAAPARPNNSNVVAQAPDGSLASRWKP